MKTVYSILILTLLAACFVNIADASGGGQQVANVVETKKSLGDYVLEIFQDPMKHVVSLLYMFSAVQDLLNKFENVYLEITKMVQTVSSWIMDLFQSRAELARQAKQRLDECTTDVHELVQLRHKIEYRCLHPLDAQTRSLCIEHNIELDQKLQKARQQQKEFRQKYDKYKEYL